MSKNNTINRAEAEALVARIHTADNHLDMEGFLSLLDPEVKFRLGSQPPIFGTEAVRGAIDGLFTQLAGVHHNLIDLCVQGNTVTFEAEVTYTLKDSRTLTLPYADILRLNDNGLILDYRIYIDLAPLFALLAR